MSTRRPLRYFLSIASCAIIFFGWLWPAMWPLYMSIIAYTLIQNLALGYCILSRWEFSLRRLIHPKLRYQYNFTTYYTYKLTRKRLSTQFVRFAGTWFLAVSLLAGLYAHVVA